MSNQDSSIWKNKAAFWVAVLIALSFVLAGAVIMTDFGQMFGISKTTVINYFQNNSTYIGISFVLLAGTIFWNYQQKLVKPWVMGAIVLVWAGSIFAFKVVVPYVMFQTAQYDAEFASYQNVPDDYLMDGDVVLVVDYNGQQKAYPRDYIWQNHIIGGDHNGEEVLMTYCIMTNLPSPFRNEFNGEEVDFKVLAQTNNNLLIWETNSGEVIQQITQTAEFSNQHLEPIPVVQMSWAGFKEAFPEGSVYLNEWDRPVEKIMNGLFSSEEQLDGDDFLFHTSNMTDTRLKPKEKIIGIRDYETGSQLAIPQYLIEEKKVMNVDVGNKKVAITYFPEYDAYATFDRFQNGAEVEVDTIDIMGNTPQHGRLERSYSYMGPFWSVWVHYYPETELITE